MGRPKRYADAAEKNRAYRARLGAETVRVDRRAWSQLEGRVNRLREAVIAARESGCPVARQIEGSAADTVIDSLAAWFEGRAADPQEQAAKRRGQRDDRVGLRTRQY